MAISRTPKSKDEGIFHQPIMAQIFDDVDGEDTKVVEKDRIAELEEALKEMRERQLEERSDLLLSQPQQWQSQVTDVQEVKPESIQLPDPALDPDGYATGLQRRVELAQENKRKRDDADRKRNEDINEKVKDLWADFGSEYPDYSEDKDRIDYVATAVIKEATKKGLDVNRYMFGAGRPRFMKDIVKKYDKVFGAPEEDFDTEDNIEDTPRPRSRSASSPSRRRPADRSRSEDDEGRSAGVFGGNDGSGRTARRSEANEDRASMIDDIQTIQRKTGFF